MKKTKKIPAINSSRSRAAHLPKVGDPNSPLTPGNPGHDGRNAGRPTSEVTIARNAFTYRNMHQAQLSMDKLVHLRDNSLNETIVVAACKEILDRTQGKPVQPLGEKGDGLDDAMQKLGEMMRGKYGA